jgi:hypothetical protein
MVRKGPVVVELPGWWISFRISFVVMMFFAFQWDAAERRVFGRAFIVMSEKRVGQRRQELRASKKLPRMTIEMIVCLGDQSLGRCVFGGGRGVDIKVPVELERFDGGIGSKSLPFFGGRDPGFLSI